MPTDRIGFAGIDFDPLPMDRVLERMSDRGAGAPYAYVVTPNVDHVVRLDKPDAADLRGLYEGADLCVCDSRVLALLARLRGIRLPVVPGSDLTVRLLHDVARPGDKIAVVGDAAVMGDLKRRFPRLTFVHHGPPFGLRDNPAAREAAAAFVADSGARFAFLAVGSPQQEMIASAVRAFPHATGTAFCIGASLDFIVGRQTRAPRLMQRLGLEWLHRLGTQPRRMWRRYLVEGPRVFAIAARAGRRDPAP